MNSPILDWSSSCYILLLWPYTVVVVNLELEND